MVISLPEPNFTLIFVLMKMKILVDLYVLHKCAGDFERACCSFLEQTGAVIFQVAWKIPIKKKVSY